MTTLEPSQVGAFCLGKGRFDMLIRERRLHLLQPLVLDGRGATETASESSLCFWFDCVVGLTPWHQVLLGGQLIHCLAGHSDEEPTQSGLVLIWRVLPLRLQLDDI